MERTRFSLLLLEPGEIYFEDFSASLFFLNTTEENFEASRQLGRLKLCSKSIVFDPQDFNQPILKILLKDCSNICIGKRPWIEGEDNVIQVKCSFFVEMLEGNIIGSYKFKQVKTTFFFLLNYANGDDCLSQVLQLHRASTLPPPEQSSMIATIVFSRQSRISFDTKWLEDIYEKVILETQANKISPLVVNPGRIVLTCSRIYFQPYNNVESYSVLKINLKNITRIICRRFLLKQVGIEIFFKPRSASDTLDHFYFTLKSKEERDEFYKSVLQQPNVSLNVVDQEIMTLKWQNRAISTYEYLLYLNRLADRSFNDLTQYPVFPWVLSNYTSETLDMKDSQSFRDLTKPIGALNEVRLEKLKERTQEMPEPKFLYGSHYSAPGFVIFYLVRKYPHYMLCLQNGRFDHPDRMFNSIADVWRNVINNTSDFKELIPEFYDISQCGDFLLNTYNINFGYRHDGSKVHDVCLPPWAENASDFVVKLRDALESEYVSENIHHWIDLIFGYKQRGKEAVKANNVFYYLCYEGAVDIDLVKDFNEKHALEIQIMEFGQIPKQIFKVPHPPRLPLQTPQAGLGATPSVDVVAGSVNLWKEVLGFNKAVILGQHKEIVTSLAVSTNNKFVLSSSKDCTIKIFSLETQKQIRSFQFKCVGISSCILLPDDNIIVIGTFDNQIMVYDIKFNKVIDSVIGHEDTITSICWGSVSECLVSSSWDCSVKVWRNIFQGEKWHRLKVTSALRFDLDSRVTCSVINSDNTLVANGTEDGEIIVINILMNKIILKRAAHSNFIRGINFSPEGEKLITCGWDGSFKVLDLLTGMELYSKTFDVQLNCLACDGVSLLLGSNSGTLYLWDLVQVKLIIEVECQGKNIYCISLSKNRKLIITAEDKMVIFRSQ